MVEDVGRLLRPYMDVRQYDKNAIVTNDLAASNSLYLVNSGVLLVEGVADVSAERSVGLLRIGGEFIGLEYLFLPDRSSMASQVTALSDSEIFVISQKKLSELFDSHMSKHRPMVLELMAQQLAVSYAELHKNFENVLVHSAVDLVWETLVSLSRKLHSEKGPKGTVVPVKVSVVSKLVGMSEEMTRRAVRKLTEDQRLARVSGGFLLLI